MPGIRAGIDKQRPGLDSVDAWFLLWTVIGMSYRHVAYVAPIIDSAGPSREEACRLEVEQDWDFCSYGQYQKFFESSLNIHTVTVQ